MDFNINNFPEGINVTLTRGIDSLEWFTGTQPKGVFTMPSFNNVRYFDWWSIDMSQVTSFGQSNYDCDAYFYWKHDETELVFDMSNATSINYPLFRFSNLPSSSTLRYTNCDKVTSVSRFIATSGYPSKLIIEGNSTELTGITFISQSSCPEVHFNIDCSKLQTNVSLFSSSSGSSIKYFSGLPNLKNSQTGSYGINLLSNLTYESCISIMENLYNFTGNGVTPTSSQGKLKVHKNFLTTVGDDIEIATSRGWVISS